MEEKRELQGVKDKLVGRLNKHKIYHKFLEKTLETADEFQEIREIIARYETLVATHTVCIIRHQLTLLLFNHDDCISLCVTTICCILVSQGIIHLFKHH